MRFEAVRTSVKRSRGALLLAVLCVCLAALTWQSLKLWRAARDNRVIADLAAGIDREPGTRAPPEALAARANFLLGQGRLEEAQAVGESPVLRAAPTVRAAVYYNLANARIRQALPMLTRRQTDRALSMISLATEEYRQALRLAPGDWNIRYNFDFAMRMVNEAPRVQLEQEGELERRPSRTQNWTDLPSLPKGLP